MSLEILPGFQSDLLMMVHYVEFKPVGNNFSSKLKNDAKVINDTKDLLVRDKSKNIYKMNKGTYLKYLTKI